MGLFNFGKKKDSTIQKESQNMSKDQNMSKESNAVNSQPQNSSGVVYNNFDPSEFQSELNKVKKLGQERKDTQGKENQAKTNKRIYAKEYKNQVPVEQKTLLERAEQNKQWGVSY